MLDEAKAKVGASAPAIAALRLLMLTGCRKKEILTLQWKEVDLAAREFRLNDGKTRAVAPEAVRVLEAIPRDADDPWVIGGKRPETHMRKLDEAWQRLWARAGLEGVKIHDLRHIYASRAFALGKSLPMFARLLGNKEVETTARCAHLDRDSIHDAAMRIAGSIAEDIL